jgi:signal transduction histidine kinase
MTQAATTVPQRPPASGRPALPPRGHHPLVNLLVGPVAPRTWLALSSLLISMVIGIFATLLVLVLVVVGVGLLPLAGISLVLLVSALYLGRWLAVFDRARIRTFDGREIAAPAFPRRAEDQTFLGWQRTRLINRTTWRLCGYQIVRGPVALALAAITLVTWSVALALIALPIYIRPTVRGGSNWWFGAGAPPNGPLVGLCVGGVLLLFAAPWVTRGLALVDLALAEAMLGTSSRDELSTEVTRLSQSRARVVDATDAERRRIERDLHDGVQPRLVSLAMTLGMAQSKFEADPAEANRLLGQAHDSAKEALADLRSLARGIHPAVLEDRGLDAALSALVAGSPVPVSVAVDLPRRPSRTNEAVAYFFVAEAVTNVAKHAVASQATVIIDEYDTVMRIVVTDNGSGGATTTPGGGLAGLADRLAAVDGSLIISSPPGGPTRLEAVIPCE